MAPETRKGIDGPGRGNGIGDVTAPVRRLLLMFIPFLLTACGDESGIHTVGGYAVDGPLAGAVVEVSGSQGATGADGHFSIDVSAAPPYRLRVSGGTLDGIPYEGVLEAWCETTECHVTPWTTAVVWLMDRYGFNAGDARAALAGMAGVDGDPFMQVLADGELVPVKGVKPNAVRDIPEDSAGLGDWVEGIVRGGGDCQSSDAMRTSVAPGCDEPPPENALSPLPLPRYVQVCNNGNLAGEGGCPDSPAPGDAGDQWACTHDRDTGLTWELKVDDPTHLRYMHGLYGWNVAANGRSLNDYVGDINSNGLCGHGDWRLPTRDELLSIVDRSRVDPAIDTAWFPNTRPTRHWSSSRHSGADVAPIDIPWFRSCVDFRDGRIWGCHINIAAEPVRLVRKAMP